ARVHLEDAARDLFDAARDAEAVHRLEAERLEDQHVERALDDVGRRKLHDREPRWSHLDCQDVTIRCAAGRVRAADYTAPDTARKPARISSRAATPAPSPRSIVAIDRPRAATSGWSASPSACVSDAVVGAPGACACPMPRSRIRRAQ